MALKEYKPGSAFSGVIGRTFDVSSPAWPEPLRVRSGKDAPGRGQPCIDEELVGHFGIPLTMPLSIFLAGGFVCGADSGSPVWDKNTSSFKFTGKLYRATVDVSGELIVDTEAQVRMAMARQ